LAHPFIKGFEQVSYCISDEEVRAVAQGDNWESINKRKKEDIEGKETPSVVYSTTFYIGLAITPKNPSDVGPRRLDISYPTTEFTKLVKMWDKFDDATMGIVVRHIKSSALPDYVFDEGERQPKLGQKRPKPTKGSGKSHNTSPELPNKRHRSSNSTTDLQTTIALKPSENGVSIIQPLSINPAAEAPGIYPTSVKDSVDIKSPQLPFGENVAVATGVVGAQ